MPLRSRFINASDFHGAISRYRDNLPDQFTAADGTPLVAVDMLERELDVDEKTTRRWEEQRRCPHRPGKPALLDGRTPPELRHGRRRAALLGGLFLVRRYMLWTDGVQRRYVSRDCYQQIKRDFKNAAILVPTVDLTGAIARGFPKEFLYRHSDPAGEPRVEKPIPHPSIDRLIVATYVRERRAFSRDGKEVTRRTWVLRFVLKDLEDILNAPEPKPELWLRIGSAMRQHALTRKQVASARRSGRLRCERFAVKRRSGTPVLRHFYYVAHLKAESERVERLKRLPKPGHEDRGWIDPITGRRYWPSFETAQRLGVTIRKLWGWRKSCQYLEGKPFEAKPIDRPLRGDGKKVGDGKRRGRGNNESDGGNWHYPEDQRELIYRRMNKLPEGPTAPADPPSETKTPKAKRGRPAGSTKLTAAQRSRYHQIVAEWAKFQHHGNKKDFVADRHKEFPGLTVKELDAARIWVRKYPRA